MDYLQTLFGFFNAPLFATFLLGMFWRRMSPTAGWTGLVSGTLAAIVFWLFTVGENPTIELPGQGAAFIAAGVAFAVDIVVSVVVTQFTAPKPERELVGFVYGATPKERLRDPREAELPFYRRTIPLGIMGLGLVVALNLVFL